MEAEVLHEKKSLAPKLRFKGFNDDWKNKSISSILTIGSGRDYKHLNSGDVPVFGTGGLMTMVDKFLYDGATVCIGRKGTIDKPMYFEGKLWTVDTLFYTHSFLESIPKFVYNLFQKIKWKEHNEASGVPSLSKATIEKVKVSIPTLPEQQKIASFLSAVDEKIQQLTRKKELLEQYKKGVMQQLFSGKLRFKDENGKAFPKWEEKKIKDVLEIGSGRDYKHLSNGDIPVFGTGGLMTTVNEFLYDGETVCIGRKGTIDKPMYYNGKIWTVDTLFYTHKFRNSIPKFIFYLFQLINWKLYNEASGVPSLSKATIEKLKFSFPSVEEQKKIAAYLSNMDNKIESVTKQITQTQNFKKGLLQLMFV